MNTTASIQSSALERRSLSIYPDNFMLSAGGILLLGGVAKIISVLGHSQMLNIPDPLFGLPFLYVIAFVGIAEILIAWLCLFTNKRTLALGLIAWLTTSLATYRIGLWTMGWHHPYALVRNLTETLNIAPPIADTLLAGTSAYLLVGSGVTLWLGHRAARAAKFQKMPCPSCGGKIQFPNQNLGRQVPCPHCQAAVTLRKPENLKMSCYFCKEHIEFPAHALGQKLKCPHCKRDITLKEPI